MRGRATLLRSIDLPDTRAGRHPGNQLRGRTRGEGRLVYVTLEEPSGRCTDCNRRQYRAHQFDNDGHVRLETAEAKVVEQRRFRVSSSYNRTPANGQSGNRSQLAQYGA